MRRGLGLRLDTSGIGDRATMPVRRGQWTLEIMPGRDRLIRASVGGPIDISKSRPVVHDQHYDMPAALELTAYPLSADVFTGALDGVNDKVPVDFGHTADVATQFRTRQGFGNTAYVAMQSEPTVNDEGRVYYFGDDTGPPVIPKNLYNAAAGTEFSPDVFGVAEMKITAPAGRSIFLRSVGVTSANDLAPGQQVRVYDKDYNLLKTVDVVAHVDPAPPPIFGTDVAHIDVVTTDIMYIQWGRNSGSSAGWDWGINSFLVRVAGGEIRLSRNATPVNLNPSGFTIVMVGQLTNDDYAYMMSRYDPAMLHGSFWSGLTGPGQNGIDIAANYGDGVYEGITTTDYTLGTSVVTVFRFDRTKSFGERLTLFKDGVKSVVPINAVGAAPVPDDGMLQDNTDVETVIGELDYKPVDFEGAMFFIPECLTDQECVDASEFAANFAIAGH